MPKKINALREKLLMCAREILVGRGYSELTIRAIATECGVVPGTIYNYFPSKEKLVESVMLEDWRARRAMLDVKMQEAGSALEAIRVLAEALDSFVQTYHEIWEKHPATMNDSSTFRKHHKQIVAQMCGMLQADHGEIRLHVPSGSAAVSGGGAARAGRRRGQAF